MKTFFGKLSIIKYLLGFVAGFVLISNGNAFSQFSVTVKTNPVTDPPTVCQTSTLVLKAYPVGGVTPYKSYTWSGASFIIPAGNIAVLAPDLTTLPGDYTITCKVKDQLNNEAEGSIVITVFQAATATATNNGPTTFCYGGSVELEAFNDVGYNFQWRNNDIDIGGATASKYNATETGLYNVLVSNSNGCSNLSDYISVTAYALPAATAGNDGPKCYHGTVNLTSGPDGMVSYSWTSNSVTPFTSSAQNPSIANATPNNSGDYTVTVTDGNSCSNSATTAVVVYADLNGGTIGSNQDICYNGDPVAFTSTTSPSGGDGAWSYSWESKVGAGAWTTIPGETGLTYDIPAGLTQTTSYQRVATNGCGTAYSNTVTVTVGAALDGGIIAADQDICFNGNPAAFTSTSPATGGSGAWTYTWQSKVGAGSWTTIAGATGLTYDVPAGVTQTTSYQRVGSNLCGIKESNTLVVTVTPAVNGGTIGSDQSICYSGDPAPFTDVVSPSGGTGAWTYSWESKVGAGLWTIIVGESGLTYDVPAGLTATTMYHRIASNSCGSSISNDITVTVYPQMVAGTIAGDQSLCYNSDPAAITSTTPASGGNGPWTYTWEYQSNCAGGWILIPGQTGLTYDPPANQTESRCYRRVATNSCGVVYSNTITITIYADLDGGAIAADQTVCSGGDPAAFTSIAPASGGSGGWTYTWESKVGAGAWTLIAGATGLTYNVPAGITQTTQYHRVATNTCGTKTSNDITVTVSSAINGGTIGSSASLCYNSDPVAFTNDVSPTGGSGAWIYTWESKMGAGAWTLIVGANGLTYDVPAGITQTTSYHRIATNDCGTATSNDITLTVYADQSGGTIAGNQNLCYNSDPAPITSTLDPSGGPGTWTYSWEYQSNCAGGWIVIPGESGLTYDPPAQTESRCFRRVATSTCGTVYSNTVTINISSAVVFNPAVIVNVTGCYGNTNGSISILATGGTPSYTYSLYRSGSFLSSQIKAAGISANFINLIASPDYEVRVTDANGCGPFSSGALPVTQPAQLVINDVSTTPISCSGSTDGTITINATGGTGALEYSIDDITYQAGNVFTVGEGYYDISVRDANGCVTYWLTQIVLVEPSEISFNYEITNITTCNGDNSGKIAISNVSGGSGTGYEYTIYEPEVWGSNPIFTNLPGGALNQYYIKVRDSHGCVKVGNNGNPITINQPSPINFNVLTTDVTTCWYNNNGTIRINSVSGGTGSKMVSIDGISYFPTTKVFTVGVGSYTVYVKDANNCIAQKPATINGPPPIVISTLTTVDVTCFGGSNGEIHATASGGTPPLEYSLDGLSYQVTGDFTGLIGKNYTLYVRDINVCVLNQPVTVNQPAPFIFQSQNKTDITCSGLNDGTITVKAQGGNAPYTYDLYNSSHILLSSNASGLFMGLSADDYTVEVTDALSCPKLISSVLTIISPTSLSITSATATDISCNGFNDGKITVVASGGNLPYTFTLYNGAMVVVSTNNTGIFNGLSAGNYTVSVDDGNSCGALTTGVLTINEPTVLSMVTFKNDLSCNGDLTGEILVSASGGTPAYQYSFDGGTTFDVNNHATGLDGGDYSVITKDSRGCEVSALVTLAEPEVLTLSLTGFDVSCAGVIPGDGRIVATSTGGTSSAFTPKLYRLDGGSWHTSGIFNLVSAGLHTVEVIDAKGCITSSTVTINEPQVITINSISSTNPTCVVLGTITVSASGGTGTLKYTLNPGGANNTTGIFTGLGAGDYTVSVTDNNNCGPITSGTISLVSPSPITINNITISDVTGCFGGNNGDITISASGGTGTLTYSIDGGTTTQLSNTFTVLLAGNYQVVVNDDANCPQGQPVSINQPAEIVITNIFSTHVTAPGANDASIIVIATGGTGALTYTLQPNNVSNLTGEFQGLAPGTYWVDVIDINNCFISTSPIQLSQIELVLTPTNLTCNGSNNGAISLVINGGTAPYTITWTGPSGALPAFNDQLVINGLAAGTYTANVTDALGATGSSFVNITEPNLVGTSSLVISNPTCTGSNNGVITVSGNGGTAPYTYTLYDALMNQLAQNLTGTFPGLIPANYNIRVTDVNSCTYLTSASVLDPLPIVISGTNVTHPSSASSADGTITINASGGTGLLTYTLFNSVPAIVASNGTGIFNGLTAGSYTVQVVDANLCSTTSGVIILSAMSVNLQPYPVSCNGGNDGYIDVIVNDFIPPLTIQVIWVTAGGDIVVPSYNDLVAGTYRVNVSDGSGNLISQTTVVTEPPVLTASVDVITQPTCAGGTNGSVSFNVAGGNLGYTVSWLSNSIPGIIATPLSTGTYNFIITDSKGCTANINDVFVDEPAPLVISVNGVVHPSLATTSDGIITVSVTGGTGSITYNLYDGANNLLSTQVDNGTFINLASGSYYISAIDANNCSTSTPEIVLSGMTITVTPFPVSCNGGTDGYIDVAIDGGLAPFNITCTRLLVSGDILMPGLTDLPAGDYRVVVTNSAGNVVISQTTVVEPEVLTASLIGQQDPACFGDASGSVTFDITGGNPFYTITWESGSSVGTVAVGVNSGIHNFTISDSKGCTYDYPTPIELFDPAKINVTQLTQFDPLCNGDATGKIIVTAEGGTGTLVYDLTGPVAETNTTGLFENLTAGVYDIAISDDNGCFAVPDEPLRVIMTEPTPIVISALIPETPLTCPNVPEGFAHLEVSGGTPDYTYLWSNLNNTPNLDAVVSGTYTVKITDAHGCIQVKDIVIPGPPMLVPDVQIYTAICNDRMVKGQETGGVEILSVTGGTGDYNNFTYNWLNFPTAKLLLSNISSGNYKVTITDEAGCIYDFTYYVPFNPDYFVDAYAKKDTAICYGNNLVLEAISNGPVERTYTYKWSEILNPDLLLLGSAPNQIVSPLTSTSYFLEIENEGGCYSRDTVTVNVYPDIDVHVPMYVSAIKDSIISVLPGETYNIDVNTTSTEYNTIFSWTPPVLFTPADSWNSSISMDKATWEALPKITMKDPDSKRNAEFIVVKVYAVTEVGCTDSLKLYARLVNNLYFGNVFSPNDDGLNDRWVVPKDYLFPDLEIKIYNRWGSLVWSASGTKAAEGWDGKTSGGNDLPVGTYYYVVTFNAKSKDKNWKPITGSVTIVR